MRQRPPWVGRTATRVVVGLLPLALMAAPARALHKDSPPEYRITNGPSHAHPPGRSWGEWFPFTASEDYEHNGNTRQEIFFFNLAFFDCLQGTTLPSTPCPNPLCPFLVQATYGAGNPDNPTLAVPFATNGSLTRIGSGDRSNTCTYECKPLATNSQPCTVTQWLAFDAQGSFFGATGPSANYRQIFLKNLATGEIRWVTSGIDGDSTRPQMNKLGGLVFFQSTAHLLPTATPAGVSQIYVYHTKEHLLRQLTFGLGPSTNPIVNLKGNLIAFESTADLLGSGANTGISQIFWMRYDRVTDTPALHQLTRGNGPSQHPRISDLLSFVAFDSSATNLPGTTGTTGTSIFITTPLEAAHPQPPVFSQLTFPDRFGDCTDPMIDEGSEANHIGFICTGDPLQNGTTGRRVFVFERSTQTLMQITGKGDVQPPIGGNLGAWFVTMSTTDNLTGPGTCGYQLYFVDYLGNHQLPHQPTWIPATQIGQLPPDVVPSSGGSPPPSDSSLIGKVNFVILPGASTTTTTTLVGTATTLGAGTTTTTLGVGMTTTTLGIGTTSTTLGAGTTTTTLGAGTTTTTQAPTTTTTLGIGTTSTTLGAGTTTTTLGIGTTTTTLGVGTTTTTQAPTTTTTTATTTTTTQPPTTTTTTQPPTTTSTTTTSAAPTTTTTTSITTTTTATAAPTTTSSTTTTTQPPTTTTTPSTTTSTTTTTTLATCRPTGVACVMNTDCCSGVCLATNVCL